MNRKIKITKSLNIKPLLSAQQTTCYASRFMAHESRRENRQEKLHSEALQVDEIAPRTSTLIAKFLSEMHNKKMKKIKPSAMQHTICNVAHHLQCSTTSAMQHTICNVAHHMQCSTPSAMQHTICNVAHHLQFYFIYLFLKQSYN